MEGNDSHALQMMGWQLFGGTVAVLAIVGVLALLGCAWAFRRLWLFVRLELMIDASRAKLNELAAQVQSASEELDHVKTEVRLLRRGLPPEVPRLVTPDRGKVG